MKTKLLFICVTLLTSYNLLNAKEITCFKKDWNSPATIQNTPLDGECGLKKSPNDMIKDGWTIKDIQIDGSTNGFNYTYIFTDEKQEASKYINLNNHVKIPSLDLVYIRLENIQNNTARINIPNLKIGQSGIVEHIYPENYSVIVANAHVIQSDSSGSIISFKNFDDLRQDALPKTSLKPQVGDIFILNYLYKTSLLIAPNAQSFALVEKKFKDHNFIHSDIFATHLKLENEPLPNKEIFTEFAKFQNIGTIFFAIDNKVHVVDSKTFNILFTYDMIDKNRNSQLPFYTRVSEIDKAFWDIDFKGFLDFFSNLLGNNEESEEEYLTNIKDEKNKDKNYEIAYSTYYKNLLGL